MMIDPPTPPAADPLPPGSAPVFSYAGPAYVDPAAVAALPPQFYDSATATFPIGAQRAALYFDGDNAHKGPPDPPVPFLHWITVIGGRAGSPAILADFEPGNPVFETTGALREWAELRITRGQRAIPYCDRADLHLALALLGPQLAAHPALLWWIPTLDRRIWTAAELSENIGAAWHASIRPEKIWANQHTDAGSWDESTLFGSWR